MEIDRQVLGALHGLGALGPWAVFPIYVAAMALFISNPLLGLAAGAMFGVWTGFLVFSISSAVSAGLVFLAGRHFTRGWIFKKIEASPKIRAIDEAVTQGGWKMVEVQKPKKSILEWVFMAAGLAVTIGVGIYATKRVQRIIATH